jgi:hypothetical protein
MGKPLLTRSSSDLPTSLNYWSLNSQPHCFFRWIRRIIVITRITKSGQDEQDPLMISFLDETEPPEKGQLDKTDDSKESNTPPQRLG